ncbi:MAG: YihY/virulence factor BrkB family protein, partial [Acidimicrobiales bacterium]
ALISGTAVMRAAEYSFNSVWDVPLAERPKSVQQIVQALEALGTIGVGLVLSTVISGFVTGQDIGVNLGAAGRGAGYVIAAALDVGLFMVAFRMLTAREVSFRDVLPGALLSGGAFWILEQVSSFIIARRLHHSQATYGHFATVITILWWFYLQGMVTLLGAQLNVVLRRHLYPRRLTGNDTGGAEERAAVA